jgi:isopenicillin N synthase-like dioxygenase
VTTFLRAQSPEEPCRSHADAGLLTLVVDPTAGLQLFDPCGAKWFDCAHLGPLEQVPPCHQHTFSRMVDFRDLTHQS